jgi:hypothetical protein
VRPAPDTITGTSLQGEAISRTLNGLTLIVAIKQSCDGCRDFVFSTLSELRDLPFVILSATDDLNGEWIDALQPILVAPQALADLDIHWPPCYVLVEPQQHQVVTEGVAFAPAQVAAEIAAYLSRPCVTDPHQSGKT